MPRARAGGGKMGGLGVEQSGPRDGAKV